MSVHVGLRITLQAHTKVMLAPGMFDAINHTLLRDGYNTVTIDLQ